MVDVFIKIVQQVGFPIAVAFWLLYRTDRRLEKQTEVLGDICSTLKLIERSVNGDDE